MTWELRHPSSKPFGKKVKRSHNALLLLLLFPSLAPSCANTGAWIVEKPPAQLSSAQRSLGNGLTLCNKKIFFFFFLKFFIFFKYLWENIQVRLEMLYNRNNWTQTNWQKKKKKELTILFISIFKRKGAEVAQYFCLKYLLLQKLKAILWRHANQKRT